MVKKAPVIIIALLALILVPLTGLCGGIKYTLKNGMTVVLKENHGSAIVAVQVWVKAGSTTEPEKYAGISHVLEHMAFKGTKKRGVGEIAREVEGLGGDINAYTTFDHTVYHITIASRYLKNALDVLSDTLANSIFDEKELKKEIEVIMEEYRMNQDDPGQVASRTLFSSFFTHHPYGRPVIGYPRTISQINRDAVVSYFKKFYVPKNMVLVVAGDIKPEQVKPLVKKYMEPLKGETPPEVTRAVEPERKKINVVVKEMDTARVYLEIGFPGVSLRDEDVFAYDLLSMILGEGKTSRLYTKVKEEMGLVDSVYAYSFTPKDPGLLMISASCDPGNVKDAVNGILGEVYRVAAAGVAPSELARAKKKTVADFIYSLESQSSLARVLGFYETALGNAFFQDEYRDAILKVTAGEIQDVAKRYFKKGDFVLSLVIPKGKAGKLNRGELARMAAKAYKKAFQEGGERGESLRQLTLRNGIRVVVRENHSIPVVAVSAGFLGGVRAETQETNGACNLMSLMLTRGTAKHSASDLSRMIEDMAGSIDSFSGRNSFGLNGQFLSEDFERGVNLMAEMVLSPTFDENEIAKKKKEVLASIKAQKDSPVSDLIRLYMKSQYGTHPYGMDPLGTPERVNTFKRDTLVGFYKRLVYPGNMVISVSGDVDADYALSVISDAFEDFSREGDLSIKKKKKVKVLEKAVRVEKKIDKLQAHFIIGFLGTDFSSSDRYALRVLASALAGQGGRLFKELRDRRSLAYSLTAFSSEQFDRGFFAFYMGTEGKKLTEGVDSMWSEIIRFLKEGIREEEVARARNYIIGNFEIGLQSNRSYAESLMFNILYGTGIDSIRKFPSRIMAVKKRDVERVARKYIDMKRYVLAILSP